MTHNFIKCSALVNDVCTNGFPAVAHCRMTERSGNGPYNVLPCMSEVLSARLFPETGAPTASDVARARSRSLQGATP